MEENKNQEKKSFRDSWKYSLLVICLISGIMLVSATIYVVYTHSFTKTINVFKNSSDGGGTPINEYVTIEGSGDLGDSLLNCDATNDGCLVTSGQIVLSNSDSSEHTCTLNTPWNANVSVSYSLVNPIVIPATSSVNFTVSYSSDKVGIYPVTTTISCP